MQTPSESNEQPANLEQRLNAHPALKAKVEGLLAVVENAEGDVFRADAAEQRVVEEIRQLGQAALQGWASREQQQQSEAFRQAHPSAYQGGKKALLVQPIWTHRSWQVLQVNGFISMD